MIGAHRFDFPIDVIDELHEQPEKDFLLRLEIIVKRADTEARAPHDVGN